MKTLKQIQYLFVAVLAMAMAACADNSPEEVFVPVELEGQGVYFAKATKLNYEVEGTEGSIDFKVYRTETSGPATVNVYSTTETTLFTIPETISFESGAAETTLTVSYANIVRGLKYDFNVGFEEGTDYGNSELNFTLLYPAEVIEEWEIISEKAIMTDNLYSIFGASNLTGEDIPSLKNIVVEKEKNSEKYRFKSPYNNLYWDALWGISLPADFELPYIVIDGEYFKENYPDNPASKGAYIIPSVALGIVMENGVGPYYDPEETNFGTVAGNLTVGGVPVGPDNASYPAGKYDKKTKTFDFGAVYHWLGGAKGGFAILNPGSFTLSLDPALLETNYERDYTWAPLDEAEGYYTSEYYESGWMQPVGQAEEDPTFYKLTDLFAEGYHFYFFYDEETGKIKVPELQKSGLSYMNNTVYMEGEGKCNNGIFTFEITFYMYNKETEARWDLQTVTETFLWGMTEYEAMVKNLPIDAYEGYYKVGAYDAMEGTNAFIGDLKVELSVVDDETIAMKGLSAMSNYDDTTYLTYDSETGLLVFTPQFLENKFANYYTFVAMAYNSSTRNLDMSLSETLVGGFMPDGSFKFITTEENVEEWDGLLYMAIDPATNSLMWASGYYAATTWDPATASSSMKSVTPSLKEYVKVDVETPNVNKRKYRTDLFDGVEPVPAKPAKPELNMQFNGTQSNLTR